MFDWLAEESSPKEAAARSGNSIPPTMVAGEMELISQQLRRYDDMKEDWGPVFSQVPIAWAGAPFPPEEPDLQRIMALIVHSTGDGDIRVLTGVRTWSVPMSQGEPRDAGNGAQRESAVERALQWARVILGDDSVNGFLAHDLEADEGCITRLVVIPVEDQQGIVRVDFPEERERLATLGGFGICWASQSAMQGTDLLEPAMFAMARVASLQSAPTRMHPPGGEAVGALPPVSVSPAEVLKGEPRPFNQEVERARGAEQLLRQALANVPLSDPDRSDMLSWADIIQPLEVTDVPPALQDLPTFADPRIETMRFSARGAPPSTLPLPPAPLQPWPLDGAGLRFEPQAMEDLLEPQAILEIRAWVDDAVLDLLEMEENGSVERRRCARVLALGPDSFLPYARGTYWDLRDFLRGSGPIKPLDLNEVKESHLNLPYFAEQLSDYPDQELLSFLLGGVSFKADLPYQLVLMPHLISLPPGIGSVQSEIKRLSEQPRLLWHLQALCPPSLPSAATGGCAPQTGGQDAENHQRQRAPPRGMGFLWAASGPEQRCLQGGAQAPPSMQEVTP